MSDFTSDYWNWFITIPTVLGILACIWLLRWMSTGTTKKTTQNTGHVWDSDLTELNNPLPRWWLGLFYVTMVFGIIYLALYPGLGTFKGFLDWTSTQAYDEEMQLANDEYAPLFQQFEAQDIATLSTNAKANKMGERLFLNHCSTCHGSDARGARGFPNLRDNAWLWGGEGETIEKTILDGRSGIMPAWEGPLGGEAGVADMVEFVLSLSERKHDAAAAERGKQKYNMFCVGCHGSEGKGIQALGSANLSDSVWLYGGTRLSIAESISKGRQGQMPAHREFLGTAKVHVIAAYIYGLSR